MLHTRAAFTPPPSSSSSPSSSSPKSMSRSVGMSLQHAASQVSGSGSSATPGAAGCRTDSAVSNSDRRVVTPPRAWPTAAVTAAVAVTAASTPPLHIDRGNAGSVTVGMGRGRLQRDNDGSDMSLSSASSAVSMTYDANDGGAGARRHNGTPTTATGTGSSAVPAVAVMAGDCAVPVRRRTGVAVGSDTPVFFRAKSVTIAV